MPYRPRFDAPGSRRYMEVRGFERRPIFRDDTDRADCLARLSALVQQVWAGIAYLWVEVCGHPASGDSLGVQ